MRKNLTRTLLLLAIPSAALCASDYESNSTNLCSFTTIAGIQFSQLESMVNADSFSSLTSSGSSNTKCNRLMRVISRGRFAVLSQMRQASSYSDDQSSQSSSNSNSYYYAYLYSHFCQIPQYNEPLTKTDLNNLNKYSGILLQAAIGCEAEYYTNRIYQIALAGAGSGTGDSVTIMPTGAYQAPNIPNQQPNMPLINPPGNQSFSQSYSNNSGETSGSSSLLSSSNGSTPAPDSVSQSGTTVIQSNSGETTVVTSSPSSSGDSSDGSASSSSDTGSSSDTDSSSGTDTSTSSSNFMWLY